MSNSLVGKYVLVTGTRHMVDERGQHLPGYEFPLTLQGVFLRELPPDASGEPGGEVFDLATRRAVPVALGHCQMLSPDSVRADLTGFDVEIEPNLTGRIACSYMSHRVRQVSVSCSDGTERTLPLSAVKLSLRWQSDR